MKKLVFLILTLLIFSLLFSQEINSNESSEEVSNNQETQETQNIQEPKDTQIDQDIQETQNISSRNQGMFFFTFGPNITLNDAENKASFSYVLYGTGFGAQIPINNFMKISPHIQYLGGYYFYDDTQSAALMTSPEYRTTYTASLLLDIPVTFHFPVKNTIANIGLGLAFYPRYGFLTSGVSEEDKTDVELINSYYWSCARFLYPSLSFSWDYLMKNGCSFGIGAKFYYQLSNLFDSNRISYMHGSMISVFARFFLPEKQKSIEPTLTEE